MNDSENSVPRTTVAIALVDGAVIATQPEETLTASYGTVAKVVEMFHPHGVYQKNAAGQWWVWRGRWLRVRKAETIQALEAA